MVIGDFLMIPQDIYVIWSSKLKTLSFLNLMEIILVLITHQICLLKRKKKKERVKKEKKYFIHMEMSNFTIF